MRDLTDKPFGVNIAQAFVRDPGIVDFVVDAGREVRDHLGRRPDEVHAARSRTPASPSSTSCRRCARAQKAVDAGVDGLVVEGGEGGGFKNPRDVATMVLLPLVRSKVDVPIIAAGGICDGATMAAAFALGAEGVQMGTRMVSAARVAGPRQLEAGDRRRRRDRHRVPEPPRRPGAARAAHRAHRAARARASGDAMAEFGAASPSSTSAATWRRVALSGQVAGPHRRGAPRRRDPARTVREFFETTERLQRP